MSHPDCGDRCECFVRGQLDEAFEGALREAAAPSAEGFDWSGVSAARRGWTDREAAPAEPLPTKCPLCGGPHLSATYHTFEELRAWEVEHPVRVQEQEEPHLVPPIEALPMGERDCRLVLAWWQEQARIQGARAERAEAALDTGVDLEVGRLASILRREWDREAEQFIWASDPGSTDDNAWATTAAAAIAAAYRESERG